nr:3'-5' exonuclease [Lysinibacillus timonensis]
MVTVQEEIKYTEEQQQVIDYGGNQLLVKGIAGSGKTLVLLQTAYKIASENPNETVAIFSFGGPLSEAAEKQLSKYKLPNITVITFHKWAYKAYLDTYFEKPNYAKSLYKYFNDALKEVEKINPSHRFIKTKDLHSFIREEISWIKGRGIKSEVEYLQAPRRGRGSKVRLSQNDRKILYQIYIYYELNKENRLDYDDSAIKLVDRINSIPNSVKYDHVFVDEAQDLTKLSLQLLVSIARKSCRIGADIGQKIYATTFTWKEVGLELRGNRVRTLQKSFRSTKQIVKLAQSLQRHDEITNDEDFTEHVVPAKDGPVPVIVLCKNRETQDKAIIEAAKELMKTSEKATVGILCRNWETATRLQVQMNRLGIEYSEIGDNKDYQRKHKAPKGTHLEPGIKFTTFHTAKGLEFYYVLIADLVNPDAETRLGDEFDWDIERRLLYVAMTRAKVELQIYSYEENTKLIKEFDSTLYEKLTI